MKKLKFSQKLELCKTTSIAGFKDGRPIISDTLAEATSEFNRARNKFAHEFKFVLSDADAHKIVNKVGLADIECTDGVCASVASAKQLRYSADDFIEASTQNPQLELGGLLRDAGGPDLIS